MDYKPKLLLVRPFIREYCNSQSAAGFEQSIGLVPPLNLCCLASAVETAGYSVTLYDCELHNNDETAFAETLHTFKPDIVGLSIITTNFRGALYTANKVRRELADTVIVCGGTHMMIFALETLSYNVFNYGFIGEAEQPLVMLMHYLHTGTGTLPAIPGLVWREKELIHRNEPWGFNQDLNLLPRPAYHLLDLERYRMPNARSAVASLFLSRGCPFECGFCFRNPQLRTVRFKSIENALDEIGELINQTGVRSINFVDETISLRKEYFIDFCERLASKKWDVEWQAPTRVTSIDEDIVRAAKMSGCHTLRLGIESGNEDVLKRIRKGITLSQTGRAVRLCQKYGIKVVAYFIIGYIGETEKTVRKTIRFACRLKPDFAAFFPATPMPGTRLCTEAENAGLVPKDYWRDFVLGKRGDALPFLIPDAGTWAARAYRSFYFSPAYLLRQLLALHSAKDLFGKARVAFNLLFMKFSRGKPAAGHTT